MPYLMGTCGECRYCKTGRESLCLTPGFISFTTSGGYAEKLACPARHLIRVPDGLSDEDAAATQIAFATAWHMLFTRAKLQPGETVLINSVGSGIGSAALQLAKLAGAFVIGNAGSDEKLARAKELGLDVGDQPPRRRTSSPRSCERPTAAASTSCTSTSAASSSRSASTRSRRTAGS